MYGYGYSLYNRLAFLGSLDPDATAFFSATGITDPTIQGAINSLCVDLKTYGVWDKMKAIYPFVGGTATTHKFNLKDARDLDAAFRLVFNGGWTHSADGATPNGTNGYADTKLIPNTILSTNSAHSSIYLRSPLNVSATGYGVVKADYTERMDIISLTNVLYSAIGTGGTSQASTSVAPFQSLILGSRTSSTSNKLYVSGTLRDTKTATNTANLPSSSYWLGAVNQSGSFFTNKQLAFSTIGDGLTDEDSANLYYSVQKFQTTLGRQVGTPIYSSNATDVNARLFLGATNIQDATITSAVDTLVQGLKTDGVWSKLKAVYPFVGGTATTHKFNLANALDEDTSFRLAFNGGLTHSSNGVQGNGTNGFANTFISPASQLSLNSTSVSLYSRTDLSSSQGDFGVKQFSPVQTFFMGNAKFSDGKQYYIMGSDVPFGITSTTNASLGLFTFNRPSSTTQNLYKNGTQIHTMTKNSLALPSSNMYLLGINNGEFSVKQFAFASIGDGLTPTEASNLYTRVQAFQTTLNRQV
jgi:hypothetical protein